LLVIIEGYFLKENLEAIKLPRTQKLFLLAIQFSKNVSSIREASVYKNFFFPSTFFFFFFEFFIFRKFLKKSVSFFGGGNRDRTCDLLNANQMLSQLSYAPKK
jgi:hypothetical protein